MFGYASNEKKQATKFHYPLKFFLLNNQWIYCHQKKIGTNKTLATILCELHFQELHLCQGEKWCYNGW